MTLRFGSDMRAHKLADILPERFGPHSLLEAGQDISLLLQPQHHDVALSQAIHGEQGIDTVPGMSAALDITAH